MTQEEKQLLLIDLCGRLPYNVQCEGTYDEEADYDRPFGGIEKIIDEVDGIDHIGFNDGEIYVTVGGIPCELADTKPFLRSMDSMTKKEQKRLSELFTFGSTLSDAIKAQDYLNSIHVDYRGLIEKGLAFKAKKRMYK